MHPEVHLRPLFNSWIDRVQQAEEVIIGPPPRIAFILFPWPHLKFPYVPVKRRGAHLERMDPLRRGKDNPVLRSFYSGSFSFHLISPAPRGFGIVRDSSHRSASSRILSAADSSNPTATISFKKCTAFRSSQAMRSSPGRGARCGCMCEDVPELMVRVPSWVCRHLSIRFLGYALGYFYPENGPENFLPTLLSNII